MKTVSFIIILVTACMVSQLARSANQSVSFSPEAEEFDSIITTFHENAFELKYRKLSMNLSGN